MRIEDPAARINRPRTQLTPGPPSRIILSSSERAVPRVRGVNPTRRICGDELDDHRACLHNGVFVPDVVHMVTTGIDEAHPLRIHMRPAFAIVTLIGGYRSCGN